MKQKNKFVDFVSRQNYIRELTIPEHIILWLNVVLSLSFFIVQLAWLKLYDQWITWLTFVATLTSIFSVMAGAKQRILCPFLGVISSILLVFVSWKKELFGTMIMHCFNIVMQTITLILWYRSSKNKVTIEPKNWRLWAVLLYIAAFVGLTFMFAWIEGLDGFYQFWCGEKQEYYLRVFDSLSLMFTVAAAFPMFKKYDFVWWVYIVADVGIAATWFSKGIIDAHPEQQFTDWSMFVSGLSMLATCILGIINWTKSAKNKA